MMLKEKVIKGLRERPETEAVRETLANGTTVRHNTMDIIITRNIERRATGENYNFMREFTIISCYGPGLLVQRYPNTFTLITCTPQCIIKSERL